MGRLRGSNTRCIRLTASHRNLAQMTAADYAVRRCLRCAKRVDTVKHPYAIYCSPVCARKASQPSAHPKSTRWMGVYETARQMSGEWFVVHCESSTDAESLERCANNKKGFMASRKGLDVSVRTVTA